MSSSVIIVIYVVEYSNNINISTVIVTVTPAEPNGCLLNSSVHVYYPLRPSLSLIPSLTYHMVHTYTCSNMYDMICAYQHQFTIHSLLFGLPFGLKHVEFDIVHVRACLAIPVVYPAPIVVFELVCDH
jgi:hypothetical protein